jgi:hypothetical protein
MGWRAPKPSRGDLESLLVTAERSDRGAENGGDATQERARLGSDGYRVRAVLATIAAARVGASGHERAQHETDEKTRDAAGDGAFARAARMP